MSIIIDLKDLSKLSSTINPGSTVLLKDGTYSGQTFKITLSGSLGKRIFIKPQNPGQVILTGGSIITFTGSYVTFANFVFKNGGSTKPAIYLKGDYNRVTGHDVSYTSSDCDQVFRIEGKGNRVDHNIFHDWNKQGVWVVVWRPNKAEDYALIDHNIFQNRISTGEDNGLECIRVGTSVDSLTSSKSMIIHNQFINCNGEIEVISNKSCDNIYYKNYMENSEGTLTLRHGNNCLVYQNRFDQKNKSNSGGIRITGENHLVINNLLENVNGNGTTRVGISINNGVSNSDLNEYFQVKNTKILNNILINCSNDYAVGVQVKTECVLKPMTSEISGTISYNTSDTGRFSSDSKCLGSSDMKYTNNKFFAKSLGSVAQQDGIVLDSPNNLDINVFKSKINNLYQQESAGPQYNIAPEDSELSVSPIEYYDFLKNKITSEIASYQSPLSSVTPPPIIPPVTPPVIPPVTPPVTPPTANTVTIDQARYDQLLSIEQYSKKIIPVVQNIQQSISTISADLISLSKLL